MAPIDLSGTWKLSKNENFDNFLKALGLNFAIRKMAASATPVLEIDQKGDEFKVVTKGMRTTELKFTVGTEFSEKAGPNDKEDTTFLPTWEGDKLVMVNKTKADGMRLTRELINNQLVQTQTIGSGEKEVTCKRIFAKK